MTDAGRFLPCDQKNNTTFFCMNDKPHSQEKLDITLMYHTLLSGFRKIRLKTESKFFKS